MFAVIPCVGNICVYLKVFLRVATLTDKIWADKISVDKIFGGKKFRQQVKFSVLLSAEILSDKVYPSLRN